MSTYFISGHRDITEDEFNIHYRLPIMKALDSDMDVKFVVGDYYGVDEMAQKFLNELVKEFELEYSRVTVYHMFEKPRMNHGNFRTIGTFQTDIERDSAMTDISTFDIAWVRPGKEGSGTHQNIIRRDANKNNLKRFQINGTVTFPCKSEVYAVNEDEARELFNKQVNTFAFSVCGDAKINVNYKKIN